MKNIKLVLVMFLVPISQLLAQSTKFHYIDVEGKDSTVKKIEFKNLKHQIKLENKTFKPSSAVAGLVLSTVVPILFKQGAKWIYNPKNYIKEYGARHSFFKHKTGFDDLTNTKRITIITTADSADKKNQELSNFVFEIESITGNPGYYEIALSEYLFKYTPVKLKSNHKKINVVVEMKFVFYDAQDFKREFSLNPIKISGLSALAAKSIVKDIKDEDKDYQIIPKMNILESVQLKITEVNSRKKDWDKWLEFYNKNQGKLSDFVIESIPDIK